MSMHELHVNDNKKRFHFNMLVNGRYGRLPG